MFYLKKIKINNFRCFKVLNCDFEPKVNIIYGNNAIGKTSLVESINVLGTCKSHRTNEDGDLTNKSAEFYCISGEFIDDSNVINEVKMVYNQSGKKITLNNKLFKSLSDYIGYFKVVMFSPEDISLIKGSPKDKRKFLDMGICLFDKMYMKTAINYKKVIKQRNEYLKIAFNNGKVDDVLLETYTAELIKLGKEIILKRKKFVNDLNKTLNDKVSVISGGNDKAEIVYLPNCDEYNINEEFRNSKKNDFSTQTTTVGPHKDSFVINIDGNDSAVFASQGQQKTLTLSIKLAFIDVIREYDQNVIVILDDVFGELDKKRQNNILKLIDACNQVFITTTSIEGLAADILKNSKIINLEKGW